MEYISAYSLLTAANQQVTKQTMQALFTAIGATCDDAQLTDFLSKIEGQSYSDLVQKGAQKMSTFSASAGPAKPKEVENVKEEVVEEKKDEDDVELDFGLFD